jgi:hypothetical protein
MALAGCMTGITLARWPADKDLVSLLVEVCDT